MLEAVANIAVLALTAEHPELGGDDDIQRDGDGRLAALDLVELARAVGFTKMRYSAGEPG